MQRRVAALAALLLGAVALASAGTLADLSSQYFSGHSGQVLIAGLNPTARDSYAILLDPQHYLGGVSPASLPLQSLARVLSGAIGLTENLGQSSAESESLLRAAAANRVKEPRANIIFNIESVGKETVDRLRLSSLVSPATPHLSMSLSSSPVTPPAASVSIAASLATGAPASAHGIVGDRWQSNGNVQTAYDKRSAAATFSAVENLADRVAAHTDGKGVTFSFSSNEALAWAFAAHKVRADTHIIDGWTQNYCFSLSQTGSRTAFRSVGENTVPALNFDLADLVRQLQQSPTSLLNNLPAGTHASLSGDILTVTYSALQTSAARETVRFDLSKQADKLFIAELQYALDLPSRLHQLDALSAALNDEEQDLLVVSFAAPTGLLETYGRESEQFRGALHVLSAMFPLLSSQFASLFNADQPAPLQTIVLMGSHPTVLQTADPRLAENVLAAHKVDLSFYPNVYLPSGEVATVCQRLQSALASVHYTAYCPSAQNSEHIPSHILVEAHAYAAVEGVPVSYRRLDSTTNSTSTVTDADIQSYQISLWFSIMFAFVIIGAVSSLAFMDIKKDTLLYSSFNPNWEDRKRR